MRTATIIYFLIASLLGISAQKAGTVIAQPATQQLDAYFTQQQLTDEVVARMKGKSLPVDKVTWGKQNLHYVRVLHHNLEGKTQIGELVCNKAIATALVKVFRGLYAKGYRIERMVLIDEYGADDDRSMKANNTSCFNYRTVSGSTRLSMHGKGLAIDVNPLYNPWVRGNKVDPVEGRPYAFNRLKVKAPVPIITMQDECYKLFRQQGFVWGGAWRSSKDYQHFEFKK